MYLDLAEVFATQEFKAKVTSERALLDNFQPYFSKMLNDVNQSNYQKGKKLVTRGLRCVLALLLNYEVSKVTLHYILPNLCDRVPPQKSRQLYDQLIAKVLAFDATGLFQEVMPRLERKNSVTILHNLELLISLLSDPRPLNSEVIKPLSKQLKSAIKRISKFLDHSESKIRKLSFQCVQIIFSTVDDDIEVLVKYFFKNVRDYIIKELRTVHSKTKKRKQLVTLFESEASFNKHYTASVDVSKNDAPANHSSFTLPQNSSERRSSRSIQSCPANSLTSVI
jgi:hypothetical protein